VVMVRAASLRDGGRTLQSEGLFKLDWGGRESGGGRGGVTATGLFAVCPSQV